MAGAVVRVVDVDVVGADAAARAAEQVRRLIFIVLVAALRMLFGERGSGGCVARGAFALCFARGACGGSVGMWPAIPIARMSVLRSWWQRFLSGSTSGSGSRWSTCCVNV